MKYMQNRWTKLPLLFKALLITTALLSMGLVINNRVGSASAAIVCNTNLHQSQVGSSSETFTQECDGSENLQNGEVLWHFVLTQTTTGDLNSQLTACFQTAGCQTVSASKFVGGVIHWNVITPGNDVLVSACTDAIGKLLNLSHVCGGGGNGGVTSEITTEIHLGSTDNGTPIVVGTSNAKAPAFVHDSGQLITHPATELPSGSTITFEFRNNIDCSGDPVHTAVFDVSGQIDPFIDPALAQGPLGPGSYSYRAIFASGDENVVPSAVSECEPFHVFSAPLTPGYWKNHLALTGTTGCSGLPSGTGCSSNGPFTKTYLPKSLGNYQVDTILKAAQVFALMNCSNTGSNSAQNQNAVGCLAGHLLATELNLANGSDPCIQATVDAANTFLISIGYVGPSGNYTGLTATQRATAISLKTTLDNYNNGGGCNNFCQ
jgi:hypothetical protein